MHLSDLVAALRAPGTPDELAGAESTVAAMAAAHRDAAAGVVPLAPVNRRPALVAAGATVGIVGALLLTGTAAAAFSGALPAGLQDAAHNLFGAPAYTPPPSESEESGTEGSDGATGDASGPVGPGASTDAASLLGLCTAFAGVASDDPQADSVAYRALASAAAAASETVEDYCSEVVAAGGKPTAVPSKKPTAIPSKKPTAAPTQKPTAVPSKKPTALPTTKAPSSAAQRPSGAGAR